MIGEQHRLSAQAPDPRAGNGLRRRAGLTQWLDARLNDICSDPVVFRGMLIVFGVLALAWVGCVGILMLRPTAQPEMGVAVPPLASAVPPLAPDSLNSLTQPPGTEHYPDFGPSPFTLVPYELSLD